MSLGRHSLACDVQTGGNHFPVHLSLTCVKLLALGEV